MSEDAIIGILGLKEKRLERNSMNMEQIEGV